MRGPVGHRLDQHLEVHFGEEMRRFGLKNQMASLQTMEVNMQI